MKPQDFTRFTPDNEEKCLYKNITEKIIGAVMEVHKILGPGFLTLKATKFWQGELRD